MRRMAAWSSLFAVMGLVCACLALAHIPRGQAVTQALPTIVIDPGHGGYDPGAIGGPQGPYEKNINLSISLILAGFLRSHHFHAYLTRTADQAPSGPPFRNSRDLHLRAALARQWHATIFVSIHTNAEPTGQASGPIVYYRAGSPASLALAHRVSSALASLSGRAVPPRPIRQLVLQEAGVPAVNVEVGFITHPLDQSRLVNSQYQTRLAQAIDQGVVHYLSRGPS